MGFKQTKEPEFEHTCDLCGRVLVTNIGKNIWNYSNTGIAFIADEKARTYSCILHPMYLCTNCTDLLAKSDLKKFLRAAREEAANEWLAELRNTRKGKVNE